MLDISRIISIGLLVSRARFPLDRPPYPSSRHYAERGVSRRFTMKHARFGSALLLVSACIFAPSVAAEDLSALELFLEELQFTLAPSEFSELDVDLDGDLDRDFAFEVEVGGGSDGKNRRFGAKVKAGMEEDEETFRLQGEIMMGSEDGEPMTFDVKIRGLER